MPRPVHSFAVMFALAGTAYANPPLHVAAPATPQPTPVITVVQPAMNAKIATLRTAAPDDKYDSLTCLLPEKDRWIKLSAKNWNVKPGGNGVLVVVDGDYATTVHDLSKPISIAEMEVYDRSKTDLLLVSPMAGCGWHWIAVVPTAPNGQMLDVAPTVSWFASIAERANDQRELKDAPDTEQPLTVINWPLMGPRWAGEGPGAAGGPSGFVLGDAKKVPFDYQVAQKPGCTVDIEFRQVKYELDDHGLYRLDVEPIEHSEQLEWTPTCPNNARYNGGATVVYGKAQKQLRAYAWPAAGKAKPNDNFWGEHKAAGNKAIRRGRCRDGHREDCDH